MGANVPLATPEALRDVFSRVVDRTYMTGVFDAVLPELAGMPLRVRKCSAKAARSRETLREKRSLLVNYTLELEADDGRQWRSTLLGAAPVGPEWLETEVGDACRAAAGHPATAPFERVATYLEDLRMGLVVFPVDPLLPALARLTRPDAGALLEPYLPECRDGASIRAVRSELKHYKPCKRSVIRVVAELEDADPPSRAVFVKLFADDRGEPKHRAAEALWNATRDAEFLRMPEPLGYDPRLRTVIMSEVPGERDLTEWIKCLEKEQPLPAGVDLARVERAVTVAARAGAELHAAPIELAGRRTYQDELVQLGKDFELVRGRVPEFEPQLDRLLERLHASAPEDERLAPSHGAFRHKQMVGDDRTLTVIDWDGLTMANPALDGATFIRRLLQEHLRRPEKDSHMVELATIFRRECLAAEPDLQPRHLDLYEAVSLTEHALRSFSRPKRKDAVTEELERVFAAAEQLLDGRRAAWH